MLARTRLPSRREATRLTAAVMTRVAPITASEMSSLLIAETPVYDAIYREKRGNSVSSFKPFIVPLSLISGETARQQPAASGFLPKL